MDRYHPQVLEQARTVIEPVLEELGFSLAEEHSHHRSFGSAHVVYHRRGVELRLVWDGKEGTIEADFIGTDAVRRRVPSSASTKDSPLDELQRLAEAIRTSLSGPSVR